LRSKAVANGALAGLHRSANHGDGIEFGGHRPYVPGDDLRWIDRRALLRHDKLIVRQFQTERNRTLLVLVDATASMGFRSEQAKHDKLQYANLLAAALIRIALRDGDRVGLGWLGGAHDLRLAPSARKDMFDRCVIALTSQRPAGDAKQQPRSIDLDLAAAAMMRPDVTVLLSDLIDIPGRIPSLLSRFAGRGRCLSVAQVLDTQEEQFPFQGPVRLEALERGAVVEVNGSSARAGYLRALDDLREHWRDQLRSLGAQLTTCNNEQDPVVSLTRILHSIRSISR
jgi:uncharacterized protein (DUF58 family)